ncbi:XRE family transcriptional regulator [Actinorhabdospora filicis]|uniref:XRE family transcriptional regulator n=1 Tax=Actinorhabdospora filicis TaxID=1785913 RepID=A0A9W6SLJ3_9ACTN|nr:helix-turn-helix transcriptional regulator [Actinorhabdospora filicis]GLZ78001.1 XRE family transcriptional regulator [Actinorhabdospora filicis]
MDRRELADFLRRARERLTPAEAGFDGGPRRRTPGLRRQEVAVLAGMSADYLMRLEQARSPQPSAQILDALARALRLSADERGHLYVLAGHRPPAAEPAGQHVGPVLRHVLDELTGIPAQVLTDLGDVLAQNALAEAVLGCVCSTGEGLDRNVVWRWFTDPFVRAACPPAEHEAQGRELVADLRAAIARRGSDPAAADLLARLRAASAEFTALWERHEVAVRRRGRLRLIHPEAGAMDFDVEALLTPTEDQRMRVFTPRPDSGTAEALALLKEIGPDTAHRRHR